MDFLRPGEAGIRVKHFLKRSLGPHVRVEVVVDQAEAVEEAAVFPVLFAQRVELLIGGQSLAVVFKEEMHVTELAVDLGVHVPGLDGISAVVVVVLLQENGLLYLNSFQKCTLDFDN